MPRLSIAVFIRGESRSKFKLYSCFVFRGGLISLRRLKFCCLLCAVLMFFLMAKLSAAVDDVYCMSLIFMAGSVTLALLIFYFNKITH